MEVDDPSDAAANAAAATHCVDFVDSPPAPKLQLDGRQKRKRSLDRQHRHREHDEPEHADRVRDADATARKKARKRLSEATDLESVQQLCAIHDKDAASHRQCRKRLSEATDSEAEERRRVIRERNTASQRRARKRKAEARNAEATELTNIPARDAKLRRTDGALANDASDVDNAAPMDDDDDAVAALCWRAGICAAVEPTATHYRYSDSDSDDDQPVNPPCHRHARLRRQLQQINQQLHPVPGFRVVVDGDVVEDADALDQDDVHTAELLSMAATTNMLPSAILELGPVAGVDNNDEDDPDGPSRETVEAIMSEYQEMHLATQGTYTQFFVLLAACCIAAARDVDAVVMYVPAFAPACAV